MSLRDRIVKIHDDYLALNKVPGESVEALASPRDGVVDLPRALRDELGGPFLPAAPHRLDLPVSGCVLFARNPKTLGFLGDCFRTPGRVEKLYWGIAGAPRKSAASENPVPPGSVPWDRVPPGFAPPDPSAWVELVHWLETGRGNRVLARGEDGPGRKRGVLRYRVLGRGEHYLFLEILLVTGRHHQIRAQLSRAGLPIKGDLKYGARRGDRGIRLHCRALAFPDPAGGDRVVRVEAPPPEIDGLWRAFIDAALPGARQISASGSSN
ncbi:MAG: RNA pseudouridine synthase [Treponema sp.]|jgi:23S rRNA pseudouridine1911/1915/1917 synthase|nr:RNA pseudouridine synthase [Treponema sp.]